MGIENDPVSRAGDPAGADDWLLAAFGKGLAFALIAFVIGQQIFAIWVTLHFDPVEWVTFFQDDAYYYLGIARNVAGHGVSAFSLPIETNGYQPLWLIVLSFAAKLVGGDRVLLVALTHAIALVAVVSFMLLSRRFHGHAWPAALAVVLFPDVMITGMETALIPPLALLYFKAGSWKTRGIFASLLFLARLDALALVAGRALYDLVTKRRIGWAEHVVLIAVVAAYMAVNLAMFGTLVPVSGLAKAVGNIPGENLPTGLRLMNRLIPALVVMSPLLLLRLKGIYALRHPGPLAACFSAVVVSALYYGILSGWPLWPWYLWSVMLVVYFVLLELADIQAGLRGRYHVAGRVWRIVALVILLTHISAALWVHYGRFRPLTEPFDSKSKIAFGSDSVLVARALNRDGRGRMTFAIGDRAGIFGYFLDDRFRVIQLEGLVGSYEQIERMRDNRLLDYIASRQPDWLIVDRDSPLRIIDTQLVVEEPIQGLSVHEGAYVLCFPRSAHAKSSNFGSRRETRYFLRFADRQPCSPAALRWFEKWRSQYHGSKFEDIWRSPAFLHYYGTI
ncbi:hypothetical protein [Novosphingobium sp. JCM 18896]|uniref:hypothetical protein n=1 Tax=Novosphingobium sp. JCM 18896 TaxID=2989731 RepID=UPI0022228BDA|nr:hypothetical protein [Novosphingobium sp. JCM 18896]MCW1428786.1 hypothetical protein [Novosphingobium sp. JCM 18896]